MQMSSVASTHDTGGFDWRSRLRAAGIHLVLSCLVAAFGALLVFAVWYPFPYRELSGGRDLFVLLVSVDVVIGPLITFAVFNRAKPAQQLRYLPLLARKEYAWTALLDGTTADIDGYLPLDTF